MVEVARDSSARCLGVPIFLGGGGMEKKIKEDIARAGLTTTAERGYGARDPLVRSAPAQVRPLGGRKGSRCWLGLLFIGLVGNISVVLIGLTDFI
jgi:hypothetical protein